MRIVSHPRRLNRAWTRLSEKILINISRLGNNPNPDPARRGEFLEGIQLADVAKARAAIEQNRQWIVGMKARLSRNIAANHTIYSIYQVQVTAHGVQKTEIGDIAWTFSPPLTMYTLRAAAPTQTVRH